MMEEGDSLDRRKRLRMRELFELVKYSEFKEIVIEYLSSVFNYTTLM